MLVLNYLLWHSCLSLYVTWTEHWITYYCLYLLDDFNHDQRKEDQNQSSVGLAAEKYRTISISSHDNVPSLNHHFQPVVHWPYTTLYAMELQSPIVQSPSPAAHQVQHGLPLLHLAQQTMPVWPDNTLSGVNAHVSYQPFAMTGGGVPASNHAPIPSYCYHFGYPFPGFPGNWMGFYEILDWKISFLSVVKCMSSCSRCHILILRSCSWLCVSLIFHGSTN